MITSVRIRGIRGVYPTARATTLTRGSACGRHLVLNDVATAYARRHENFAVSAVNRGRASAS
jgi:hypothetical protein